MWSVPLWPMDLDTWFPVAGDVWEVCGSLEKQILTGGNGWLRMSLDIHFIAMLHLPLILYFLTADAVWPDGWRPCSCCHVFLTKMPSSIKPESSLPSSSHFCWVFCLSNKRSNVWSWHLSFMRILLSCYFLSCLFTPWHRHHIPRQYPWQPETDRRCVQDSCASTPRLTP